jgi:hypothetical protein
MNIVPKEGGNTFKTILSGTTVAKGGRHQPHPGPQDRGLKTNKTIKLFDEAASVGGPIMQNKLWFFGAVRTWGLARQFAGVYWNKTQNVLLSPPGADLEVVQLTPWVDRPLDVHSGGWEWYDTYLGRLTWQAGSKHKFNLPATTTPRATAGRRWHTLGSRRGPLRAEPLHPGTYNRPLPRSCPEGSVGASILVERLLAAGRAGETVAITDVATDILRRHRHHRGHPITPTATWCAAR